MIGITFRETMSGALHPTGDGGDIPFAFTVTARGRRLGRVALGAPLDLSGTVTFGDSVDGAAASGWLTIDAVLGRELVYEVRWRDGQDRPWRFYGKKDLSLLHPVRSMTTLRGTVYQSGEAQGAATLYFALRDLPGFLAGMRPTRGGGARA